MNVKVSLASFLQTKVIRNFLTSNHINANSINIDYTNGTLLLIEYVLHIMALKSLNVHLKRRSKFQSDTSKPVHFRSLYLCLEFI